MTTLKEALKNKLTEKQLALTPSSYDIVGDLAIFSDFPKELKNKEKLIAQTLIKLNKQIKVVLKKIKKYSGTFRTPKLKHLAGEKRKETELKENNVRLKLNPEKAYFSIRQVTERKRIAEQVKDNEEILVMFSGIAVYPIVISKNTKAKHIVAIEKNSEAHKYAIENLKLNKIKNIELIKGDVKRQVPKLNKKFDRILMPLPRSAETFLNSAFIAAKKGTTIHLYQFTHENEFDSVKQKLRQICKEHKINIRILNLVKCGHFGPSIYRVCIDFKITKI